MTDKAYVNGITWSPWMSKHWQGCPDFAKELPVAVYADGHSSYPKLGREDNQDHGKDFPFRRIEWFRIPMDDFCELTGLDISEIDLDIYPVNYIAQDTSGLWYGYRDEPSLDLGYWQGIVCSSLNKALTHPKTICHERDTLICVDDYKEYLGLAEDSKEDIIAGDEPKIIDGIGHYNTECGEIIEIFDIQGYFAVGQGSGGALDLFHVDTGRIWQNGYGWMNDDDKIVGKAMTYSEKAKLLHPEIPWECFEDNADRIEYLSNNSAFIGNSTYTERVPHTIKIPRYWSDGSEITDVVVYREYEDN